MNELKVGQHVYILYIGYEQYDEHILAGTVESLRENFGLVRTDGGDTEPVVRGHIFATRQAALDGIDAWLNERRKTLNDQLNALPDL